MAANGILPKRLLDCQVPKCPACMYGKLTKKPWRTKSTGNINPVPSITKPGDCISVDQLESRTPGFIAQLKGKLTNKRYRYATIFVNHYSRFGYVHLMTDITSEATVAAKKAFEAYCTTHNVQVKHYHADNGRFADNLFLQSIKN